VGASVIEIAACAKVYADTAAGSTWLAQGICVDTLLSELEHIILQQMHVPCVSCHVDVHGVCYLQRIDSVLMHAIYYFSPTCCCQAVTNDLERFKEQLAAAQTAADTAAKRQAAADSSARRNTARQQQVIVATSQAVAAVARLLFSCLAVMSGAAAVMQQHCTAQQAVPPAAESVAGGQSSPGSIAAAAAAAAVVASGLADMVCLSHDELADLLGCEDETCQLLLAAAPHDDSCAAAAAGSAATDGNDGMAATDGGPGLAAQAVQRLMRAQEARYMQQQSLLRRQLDAALAVSSSTGDDLAGGNSAQAAKVAGHHNVDVLQYVGANCSRSCAGDVAGDSVRGMALQPVLAALQLEASAVQGCLQAAVVAAYAH
jgi:hypothetical protein